MSAAPALLISTIAADVNVDGTRSFDVLYQVETTDRYDQALSVLSAAGLPRRGDYYRAGHDVDLGAWVKGYAPKLKDHDADRKLWEVVVKYSSAGSSTNPQGDQGQFPESPWLAPARISGSGTKAEELARWHFTDPDAGTWGVLKNSAGWYFDDEFRETSHLGISISQAYQLQDFDIQKFESYADCVNAEEFFDAPRDYYKMAAPRWQLLYTGEGVAYIDAQLEFEGKRYGWNEQDRQDAGKKVDEGYYYIDQSVPGRHIIKRFTDDELHPISGKGRLNGWGDRLTPWDAAPVHFPPDGVNKYLRVDFADLKIPTKLPTK